MHFAEFKQATYCPWHLIIFENREKPVQDKLLENGLATRGTTCALHTNYCKPLPFARVQPAVQCRGNDLAQNGAVIRAVTRIHLNRTRTNRILSTFSWHNHFVKNPKKRPCSDHLQIFIYWSETSDRLQKNIYLLGPNYILNICS